MYIFFSNNGRSLRLTIPPDWTPEDVKAFVAVRPQLVTVENADASIVGETKAPPEGNTADVVMASLTTEAPSGLATSMPDSPNGIQATSMPEKGLCPDHPGYRGLRMGALAKQCPNCVRIYNDRKAQGIKESRNYA